MEDKDQLNYPFAHPEIIYFRMGTNNFSDTEYPPFTTTNCNLEIISNQFVHLLSIVEN